MLSNCKKCGEQIPNEVWKTHKKINAIFQKVQTTSVRAEQYCEKCLRSIFDVIDAITAEEYRYNWIGSKGKLNYKRIKSKNKGYAKFVEDNKLKEFTLKLFENDEFQFAENLVNAQYQFKEIEDMPWAFHISEITILKDNRLTHKPKEEKS